jgi:hypothetical protein
LVHTYDSKPKRRQFDLLKSQGLQANQDVTFPALCSKRHQQKEACTFLAPLAEGDWGIFLSAGGYGSAFSAFRGGALA